MTCGRRERGGGVCRQEAWAGSHGTPVLHFRTNTKRPHDCLNGRAKFNGLLFIAGESNQPFRDTCLSRWPTSQCHSGCFLLWTPAPMLHKKNQLKFLRAHLLHLQHGRVDLRQLSMAATLYYNIQLTPSRRSHGAKKAHTAGLDCCCCTKTLDPTNRGSADKNTRVR